MSLVLNNPALIEMMIKRVVVGNLQIISVDLPKNMIVIPLSEQKECIVISHEGS